MPQTPTPISDESWPATRAFKGELINKAACRRFLLDYARQTRYHGFSRIDPSIFAQLNGLLRSHMRTVVMRNPSCGKTIH
jgi:hypothetical protein